MDVLKKIRSASLVESLTASVIILIVFAIALTSFNTIFQNNITRDHTSLTNRVNELRYLAKNGKLEIPFHEEKDYWIIHVENNGTQISMEINNSRNDQMEILTIELN